MGKFVNPYQELNPPRPRKERHTATEADYFGYIASLPCCLTGGPAQVAHINHMNRTVGHHGRGKGEKAHYSWTIPLCPDAHQQMDNTEFKHFWVYVRNHFPMVIYNNTSPYDLCARLARVHLEYPDPDRIAVATQVIESWRAGE